MEPTTHQRSAIRRNRGMVWLAAAAAAAGIGIGAAGIASAATSGTSSGSAVVAASTATTVVSGQSGTSGTSGTATPPQQAPKVDPASLPNGPGETVLTGDTASKVKAAVEAAEPNATIIRLETDSGGHAYEAHVKLADGTVKTLYFNSSFAADGSDTGFGGAPGGPGGHGTPGQLPTPAASTTATNG